MKTVKDMISGSLSETRLKEHEARTNKQNNNYLGGLSSQKLLLSSSSLLHNLNKKEDRNLHNI